MDVDMDMDTDMDMDMDVDMDVNMDIDTEKNPYLSRQKIKSSRPITDWIVDFDTCHFDEITTNLEIFKRKSKTSSDTQVDRLRSR